jgi:tetratricopeptide (TPR) repeat protein
MSEIEAQIRNAVEADQDTTDSEVEELSREHARTVKELPSVGDMTSVGVLLLGMILLLEAVVATRAGWRFDVQVAHWSIAFLSFAVLFLAQVVVLVAALLDARRVKAQVFERQEAYLWGRVATLVNLFSEREPDFGRVKNLANTVVRQAPGVAWATRLRGRARLEFGERQQNKDALHQAIAELSRAMDLKEESRQSPLAELRLRARALVLLGAFKNALIDYTEAVKWGEGDPDLYMKRGELSILIAELAEERGDKEEADRRYAEARRSYEQATKLDWLGVKPILAWADLVLRANEYPLAITLVEEALSLEPGDEDVLAMQRRLAAGLDLHVQALLASAESELQSKEYQRATAIAGEALRLKPGDPDALAMQRRITNAQDLAH